MSSPVCQTGIATAGGVHLTPPQDFVRINGSLVTVHGTPVQPHGLGEHGSPATSNTSGITRINGVRVSRNGEAATCGHVNSNGADWVRSD